MNAYQRHLPLYVLIIVVFSLTGCDAFKTIGDYFKGPKTQNQHESQVPPQATSVSVDPTAVIQVDGWSLGKKDFQQQLDALKEAAPDFDITSKENRKAIAEELANQHILLKEAEQLGLIDRPEIKASVEDYRKTLLIRSLANQLTKDIVVSDDDVKKFFEEQKQYMVTPTAWHIRAIVMDNKEELNKILADILGGADFADQAKAHSKIPGAAENGGDVGFWTADQIPFPELGNEISTLGVGDLSKVFQGPDGFYLIKLEGKRGGDPMAFEDVKEQIRSTLLSQKQQEFMGKYTQELRSKSKVTINENLL